MSYDATTCKSFQRQIQIGHASLSRARLLLVFKGAIAHLIITAANDKHSRHGKWKQKKKKKLQIKKGEKSKRCRMFLSVADSRETLGARCQVHICALPLVLVCLICCYGNSDDKGESVLAGPKRQTHFLWALAKSGLEIQAVIPSGKFLAVTLALWWPGDQFEILFHSNLFFWAETCSLFL